MCLWWVLESQQMEPVLLAISVTVPLSLTILWASCKQA